MCKIRGNVSTSESLCPPTQGEKDAGCDKQPSGPACVHEESHPYSSEGDNEIADGGLNRKQGGGQQRNLEHRPPACEPGTIEGHNQVAAWQQNKKNRNGAKGICQDGADEHAAGRAPSSGVLKRRKQGNSDLPDGAREEEQCGSPLARGGEVALLGVAALP